jgi:hypothetical protein
VTRRLACAIAAIVVTAVVPPAQAAAPTCDGLPATIVGTMGDDTIVGTPKADVIAARGGDDVVRGRGGSDVICGDGGDDLLIGNEGRDIMFGGGGGDTIHGKAGHDVVAGGSGADTLVGGDGRDSLAGDSGNDTARGGAGLDWCNAEAEPGCDDDDPSWYATPDVRAGPLRTVTVDPAAPGSLEAAFAEARPGDLIRLLPGTHVAGGSLVLRESGTRRQWIQVVAANPAQRPVVDLAAAGELRISASFVLLEGVDIRNGGGNNLHIAPENTSIHDIVVRSTVIHDLASGPGAAIKVNRNNPEGAGVDRVYLEDNDVSESLDNAVIDGVGVSRAVARGNHIHDNDPGSHGIFFKGGSSRILIEGNLIDGIRGNAALQLGGNTGPGFFDPAHAGWEGVHQVARNNLIADFDDSAVEIRGVKQAAVLHNTVVTQTSFAVFRLSQGNTDGGGAVGNDDIIVANNLIVGTGGDPQYARNDGGATSIDFGRQLWAGTFHNSGSATPGIPQFPRPGDVVAPPGALGTIVVMPSTTGLDDLAEAIGRYRPAADSPALAAAPVTADALRDLLGVVRAPAAGLGAVERP